MCKLGIVRRGVFQFILSISLALPQAGALDISDRIRFSLEFEEYRNSFTLFTDGNGQYLAVTQLPDNQDPLFWGRGPHLQQLRSWPVNSSNAPGKGSNKRIHFEDLRLGGNSLGLIEIRDEAPASKGQKQKGQTIEVSCGKAKATYVRADRKDHQLIRRAGEFNPLPIEPRKLKHLFSLTNEHKKNAATANHQHFMVALVTPRFAENDNKRFQVFIGEAGQMKESNIEELSVYYSPFGQDSNDGQLTIKTNMGTLFIPGSNAGPNEKIKWNDQVLAEVPQTQKNFSSLGLEELEVHSRHLPTPCDPFLGAPSPSPRTIAADQILDF